MKNIEKYKDEIINAECADLTCSVHDNVLHLACIDNCRECKTNVVKWLLEEYSEPILDDAEREYLSAVIKPFRDKVKFIKLPSYDCLNLIYTCIRMYDKFGGEIVRLPNFKIGTMYKGMEIDKSYTLQELGL